jgi:hypothetical protein
MNELNGLQTSDNHVDHALRAYFRAEMPSPWPEARIPHDQPRPRRSLVQRFAGRTALAASILLLIIGYLALAGAFPAERRSFVPNGPTIGSKPDRHGPQHQRPVPMP